MEDARKTKKQLIEELNCLRLEQIEQTRVTSEKFTKAFLQNSIPMTITTVKEGRFFDVSDAFLQLVGLKRHEVIGHTSREAGFITEEQRAFFYNELSKKGRVENLEMEVRPKGRGYRYGLFNVVMMSINNANYLLTTIQDITERKQAEAALRIQHNLVFSLTTCHTVKEALEHILDAALQDKGLDSGGIYLNDPVTGTLNLSVTCGHSPEMVEHTSHLAADSPQVIRARAGTSFYGRYTALWPPGKDETRDREGLTALASIPVLHKGNLVAIMNMASHVHDDIPIHTRHLLEMLAAQIGGVLVHIHSEEKLRENEEKYRQLFELEADAILLVDKDTGNLIEANRVAESLYGYSREELLRMKNIELSAEPDETKRATQEAWKHIPIRYHRKKDGTIFPVEIMVNIFPWQGRQVHLAAIRDITLRKQAEAQRAELEARNRQLQKAESLGRMAGAIAHTFNNQLGVVIGNLEMAIDELPKGAGPVNSLTAAMRAANEAAAVSGQMLTYLGQSFDKRELLDIAEACLRNLPIIQASMPGTVTLETNLPSPGPAVMANAIEIQQVLTNLITNAWEVVGTGRSSIHLSVKTVSPADIPTLHRRPIAWQPQDGPYACLEVTDTGCGIPDKDIENLYDPFFSSKFIGRGLGLPVVLGIVKAHDGAVTVESAPGQGSTFRVYLPVSAAEVPRQPDKAAQPTLIVPRLKRPIVPTLQRGNDATTGSGTILLVDDEMMLRDIAAAMLTRLGFTVLAAKDGVEALEVFRQRRDEICLVLSDLTMPRMDGWETLTALRQLAPDLPVILASGYDKVQVMAGDHPELPQVFLGKPYGLQGLSDAISHALVSRKK
ncbi:MAG: PAS domain S-box protein [Deltaproteobacteria bacterium]|nr:PAS domain S-box protein [Deltaproteobacteria bacterium]